MSLIIDIADAVTLSLNEGSFDPAFDAYRKYVPVSELSDLATLTVTVVPKSVEIVSASRSQDYFDCTIDVGIQQKIDTDDSDAVDALSDLAEQVIDHLRHTNLTDPAASWTGIANDPIFSVDNFDNQRVFTSLISVTYRARR